MLLHQKSGLVAMLVCMFVVFFPQDVGAKQQGLTLAPQKPRVFPSFLPTNSQAHPRTTTQIKKHFNKTQQASVFLHKSAIRYEQIHPSGPPTQNSPKKQPTNQRTTKNPPGKCLGGPYIISLLVPTARLELAQLSPLPPQDSVSTNSTTSACSSKEQNSSINLCSILAFAAITP